MMQFGSNDGTLVPHPATVPRLSVHENVMENQMPVNTPRGFAFRFGDPIAGDRCQFSIARLTISIVPDVLSRGVRSRSTGYNAQLGRLMN
jgi:hypothetical protein